jgi:hypothetical protein
MDTCWLVQVLYPLQKFERQSSWNFWNYGVKIERRGHLQRHDLPNELHKHLESGLKVIRGDTQTDNMVIS